MDGQVSSPPRWSIDRRQRRVWQRMDRRIAENGGIPRDAFRIPPQPRWRRRFIARWLRSGLGILHLNQVKYGRARLHRLAELFKLAHRALVALLGLQQDEALASDDHDSETGTSALVDVLVIAPGAPPRVALALPQ